MDVRTLIFIALIIINFNGRSLTQESAVGPLQTSFTIDKPVIHNLDQTISILKDTANSVVKIKMVTNNQTSYGTGFYYRDQQTLVTNYHVIALAPDCIQRSFCSLNLGRVKNSQSVSYVNLQVEVLQLDKLLDIAVLKIPQHPLLRNVQPLRAGHNTTQELFAVGFYHDSAQINFSKGRIIQSGRVHLSSMIIGAGFSGAPVVNTLGQVVGIVTSFRPMLNQPVGLAQFVSIRGLDAKVLTAGLIGPTRTK